MVDFRYHLVSIVAVFLALAIGIVLGTAALNGPIQTNLNNNLSRVTSEKRTLESDVEELRAQVAAADSFAASVGPRLVSKTLTDRRVLLVTTSETPADAVERLTPLLERAGAQVTGRLQLLPALSEPASRQLVEDLVASVVPAQVSLPDTGPVGQATAELAAALMTTAEGGAAVEPEEAQAVLSAFGEAELVEFASDDETLQPATLAVVLTGAPEELDETGQQQQEAVLDLAAALDARSDGTVVAGPTGSAAERGLVERVRAEPQVAAEVSTVDNADRATGLVAVVLALVEQLRGAAGQYGAGAGVAGALPSPAAP